MRLSFSENKFTLSPDYSLTIAVTANDEGIKSGRLPVWSGWVTVNGRAGTLLSLPYRGVNGSLRDQTVLPPDGACISFSNGPLLEAAENGTKFTLPHSNTIDDSDAVFPMVFFLALGTSTLRADVVSLDTNSNLPTKEFFGTKAIDRPPPFPTAMFHEEQQVTPGYRMEWYHPGGVCA